MMMLGVRSVKAVMQTMLLLLMRPQLQLCLHSRMAPTSQTATSMPSRLPLGGHILPTRLIGTGTVSEI